MNEILQHLASSVNKNVQSRTVKSRGVETSLTRELTQRSSHHCWRSKIESFKGDVDDIKGFEVEGSFAGTLEYFSDIHVINLLAAVLKANDPDAGKPGPIRIEAAGLHDTFQDGHGPIEGHFS